VRSAAMEQESVARLMRAEADAKREVDDAKKGAPGSHPVLWVLHLRRTAQAGRVWARGCGRYLYLRFQRALSGRHK
jgi:hypothetical protein